MARETFKRIPLEKQELILDVATREFGENGYHKANVNTIADKAGISIGAMYKYFSSKEELFCETLEMGISILNTMFSSISHAPGDPFEKVRAVFENVLAFAREKPYPLQIYMMLLSSNMDEFAKRYAHIIEEVGHTFFKQIIKDGIRDGYIDEDLDIDTATFFLDNHLMMFTFSQISLYLKIRQETFLEGRMSPERVIDETVRVCKRIFGAYPVDKKQQTRNYRERRF
jgi:AcrR family transcriptional regulator